MQNDNDPNIPNVQIDTGYTVRMFDDEGNLRFQGNVIQLEKDRARSQVKIVCYDNLWILNHSKTTQRFSQAFPEDIARSVCSQMGVKVGNIATTNTPVSFIANSKTGYQIIAGAY